MKKLNEKYFCIYGGGSVRGMAYVGAMMAMEELGIERVGFAGSSVGSLFAVFDAIGYTYEEISQILMDINYELFKDINFSIGWEIAISKGDIFYNWVKEVIEKKYYGEKYNPNENQPVCFKDIDKDLVIVASDFGSASYKEFSRYTEPDFEIAKAIRASAAMPGLMKALDFQGKMLIDGDFHKTAPLWSLSNSMLPDNARVLEYRLEGRTSISSMKTTIDFINALISNISIYATQCLVNRYQRKDKFDYIVLETKDVSLMEFNLSKEKRVELVKMGYDVTYNYFTQVLKEKRKKILVDYKTLYFFITKIQEKIHNGNVYSAKKALSKLFLELPEIKKTVDLTYYELIIEFKKAFYMNISKNIFGFWKISNKEFLNVQLTYLASEIWKKIKQIEEYQVKIEEINAEVAKV